MRSKRKTRNEGFTLIEVALAIVVVAVGLMAVFSLIGSGLDASRKAVAETYAAIFANSVFHGLRSGSLAAAEADPANGFKSFWDTTVKNTGIIVPANDVWQSNSTMKVKSGPIGPLPFITKTLLNEDTNIKNNALQYQLTVALKATHGYASTWYNRAEATLKVWDGDKGNTSVQEPYVFYSEFSDPGGI